MKSKKEFYISQIEEELLFYFKEGYINPRSILNIDGIKFSQFSDIINIHFFISNEVEEFILSLRTLKGRKNSIEPSFEEHSNRVKGAISWQKTFEYRHNNSCKSSIYVCENPTKFYGTNENIVLKKAIELLFNLAYKELGLDRFFNYQWFSNGETLLKILKETYLEDPQINNIDINTKIINDRMIKEAMKSRKKIYRDAAHILLSYKKLWMKNSKELIYLFSKTYIEIQELDTIFELYVIIKYIEKNFSIDKHTYNVVDGKEEYLLSIVDSLENTYEVYHDKTAVNYLSFNIGINEIDYDHWYPYKIQKIYEDLNNFRKYNGSLPNNTFWRGRPDLIIIKTNNKKEMKEIIIGEIKCTTSKNYMYKGLYELLEYLNFMRLKNIENDYVCIRGLLFVESIRMQKKSIENIEIISTDEYYDEHSE